MKEYLLMVNSIPELEGNYTIAYQSKGHHDKHSFALATLEAMKYDCFNGDISVEDIEQNAEHLWQKVVPWGGGGSQLINSDTHKKGWYPVTTIDV